MSRLEELVAGVREGVARRRAEVPQETLTREIGTRTGYRPFSEALVGPGLSVISEFKRRSPSAGDIRSGADLRETVAAYERGGAAALSILTEERLFGGSLEDLRTARDGCDLPILRKDFTVDVYQLYEAAAAGGDAVLLVVAALDDAGLESLHQEARALDLDCLVEVHDEDDLERALALDAEVIGINNRDLRDFQVDVSTTRELLPDVPAGKTVVAESGYEDRGQLEELERMGVDAVLIGEALMRADDPEGLLRVLTPDEETTREHPV
ncbi:MAG TPA: indole-3-glycerol phosphate synthase TrpC [Solirubrobacterales bacterium]|nr:indole-3-glycerol phosphate synthase TrpC [Solirubrobacterales bacterium]